MKNRILAATMALSVSLFAANAIQAQPLTDNTVTTTVPASKGKTVKVHMRNDTSSPVTVQGGDQQIVLQPGKEATLKVPAGTPFVSVNATPGHPAGGVFGTADSSLNGATLIIN